MISVLGVGRIASGTVCRNAEQSGNVTSVLLGAEKWANLQRNPLIPKGPQKGGPNHN